MNIFKDSQELMNMDKGNMIVISLLVISVAIISVSGLLTQQTSTGQIVGNRYIAGDESSSKPSDENQLTQIQETAESICTPNWECSSWSECSFLDARQTRTCTDSNECDTPSDKPTEKQACEPIGKFMEFDGLKFIIERMQKVNKLEYDTWGDTVNVFRVDIKVENNASNKLSISNSDIKIIDEKNNILTAEYKSTIDLSNVLSGATKEGYFLFGIPSDSVKKIEIGKYVYDFEIDRGYTYQQLYEEEYLQNSKGIMETNKTNTWGDFKVTLERVGFYTLAPRYSSDDTKTYFRADVKVENIGSITNSFRIHDAALVVGGSQYDSTYGNSIETYDMRPGVIREGYILFENVPKDITGLIRLDVGSAYWESSDEHRYTSRLYSFYFQYP